MKILRFLLVCCFSISFHTSLADYIEVHSCGKMKLISGDRCENAKVEFSFDGCHLKEKPMMAKHIECEKDKGIARLGYKGYRYQGHLRIGQNSWGEPTWVVKGKLQQWVKKSILETQEAKKEISKKNPLPMSYGMPQGNPSLLICGDFRYSMGQFNTTTSAGKKKNPFKALNNASRLGFKGSLGNGDWKALYHYELGAVNDDVSGQTSGTTSRFFWAGLKNKKYGTLKYGLIATPYKKSGLQIDPLYDTAAGTSKKGATFGLSTLTDGFTSNALTYKSPKIYGLQLEAATFLAGSDSDSADYNFGLKFKKYGFNVGAYYAVVNEGAVIANSTAGDKALRLYGQYKSQKWSLGVSSETFDSVSGNDSQFLYIAGTYKILDKTKLAASFGTVSDTGSTASDGTGFTLAIFQNIIEKTEAHLLFSSTEFDDNSKDSRIVVGISHKFGWNM